MTKAHQIKLNPTKSQEAFFRCSCGVARFSFNWALNRWQELYELGEKISAYSLIKELTAIKREQFPWMMEVGKTCPQYAIHNLEYGFKRFFKKISKHPKFKKKGIKDSFIAVENKKSFKQKDLKIWVPRLGWVKCHENLRFEGKVNYVAVKRIANMWFAVVNIETKDISIDTPIASENQAVVGVDMGIKSLAILSDGTIFENPKALKKNLKSLKRLQRGLSRKVKGSKNRKKQQMKVAKKHYRISCIRKNALHQASCNIVKRFDKIVIEDLAVSGMIKNHKLAQSLSDVSFSEFRRQLEYKAKWANKELVIADKFFASSKTCSACGFKKEKLKLSERIFCCETCGNKIDRDLNAAINLANYRPTLRLSESKARGEWSSMKNTSFSRSKKQEINK